MDRHQPHRVERLALDRRLRLARLARARPRAPGDQLQERVQVRAVGALVLAGQAHQLAHVRQPALTPGHRQDGQVVAGQLDDPVDQRLDRCPPRRPPLHREPLGKPSQPLPRRQVEPVERAVGLAEHSPWIDPSRARHRGQDHQRVGRHPDQRRGQHRVERLLGAGVGQRLEVADHVDHLRVGPVAAPADHVGGNPPLLERALVDPQVGGGAREQHDVAGGGGPAGKQPLQPAGERARLGHAPRRPEPLHRPVGPLVGHQQFDERLVGGRCVRHRRSPRPERPELLAQRALEHAVDHLQDLRTGAEVGVQRGARAHRGQRGAPLLEQLNLGVPEAVDRLLGVADHEQVVLRERLDQVELHAVGVLELVDHDPGKPRPVALAQLGVRAQELPGLELEVLEVEPRDVALGARVALGEQVQQAIEEIADPDRRGDARRPRGTR